MSDFDAAIKRADKVGTSKAADDDFMAQCCQRLIPFLCGAVSPVLVWEGAKKHHMTSGELMRMAHEKPLLVAELQWVE